MTVRNQTRHIVAVGAAYVAMALSGTGAVAGLNRWTAIGPEGENVIALVVDPQTPSTVFAGTSRSGVLKTTDAGANWVPANSGLAAANVLALAIDPVNPSTLYAGTETGIFRSANSGRTWTPANNGLGDATRVTALAVDPRTTGTLYAATPVGVFKTINGAGNWMSINDGLSGLTPRVIAIDPISPTAIYVGVDDDQQYVRGGVFKSIDAGTSWARIYMTPFAIDSQFSIAAIAIDLVSPSRLYLALGGGGLVRSLDGGANWSSSLLSPPQADVWSLAIDPASSATLYAGTYSGAVFRTADAGDHWTAVSNSPLAAGSINVIATTASAPATVYAAGNRTGIFRSLDRAQTWIRLPLGVGTNGVDALAVDSAVSSTIYVAAGGVVAKTTDGGIRWAESGLGISDMVSSLVIDPAFPSTLYASNRNDLYKSADAGAHWAQASSGLPVIGGAQALAIAPSRTSTLYAGVAFEGVFKSIDGASSWKYVSDGLRLAVGAYVSALAVDPTSADIVYAATSLSGLPNTEAKIFKSSDGAALWRPVPIGLPTGTSITSLAVDPIVPSTIYATYAHYHDSSIGGVFKSSDSGETWTVAQVGLPAASIRTLAIDPRSPSQIYAATHSGAFRTTNGAASWTPINSGLPNLDVGSISIDRTGLLLRAATSVGLFEYRIGPALPPPATVSVVEFFHAGFGHYFVTSDVDEIAKLDNGTTIGWQRTGFRFNAYATPGDDTSPVCRFFSTAFAPKSSHFYTSFAFECTKVQANTDWLLESTAAFNIAVPAVDGSCAAGTLSVFRLYNDGQGAAPNHRYTTDLNERARMLAQGWVPEGLGPDGVEMCSPI
jgi:photosystem II stability/assembly factor-like uncharacterized protein